MRKSRALCLTCLTQIKNFLQNSDRKAICSDSKEPATVGQFKRSHQLHIWNLEGSLFLLEKQQVRANLKMYIINLRILLVNEVYVCMLFNFYEMEHRLHVALFPPKTCQKKSTLLATLYMCYSLPLRTTCVLSGYLKGNFICQKLITFHLDKNGSRIHRYVCQQHELFNLQTFLQCQKTREEGYTPKNVIYNLLLFGKSKTVTVKVVQLGNGKPH